MTDSELKALQTFYDTTITHLVKQGKRAMAMLVGHIHAMCAYRTPEGLTCAAGVHIPDKFYEPSMETHAISVVVARTPELNSYFPNMSLAFALQRLHDEGGHWDATGFIAKESAKALAYNFGLVPYDFTKVREL